MTLSNKEYHQHPAISNSRLGQIAVSPAYYKYRQENPEPDDKPHFVFGSLVHTLILEPDKFNDEYAVCPKLDKRTKQGKLDWANFQEANKDKRIIAQDDFTTGSEMAEAVHNNPICMDLLQDGEAEKSIFWEDSITKQQLKCRPDYIKPGMMIDVKTTQDASPRAFAQSIWKFRYQIQAAHYLDSTPDCSRFVFLAIEKKAPYQIGIYELDAAYLVKGLEERNRNLNTLLNCIRYNDWPDYSQSGSQTIKLPDWMEK